MEINQSRFSNKTKFIFGDDSLIYTLKDMGGRQSFSVPYISILKDRSELEERNPWFRNVGLLWVLIGIIQTLYVYHGAGGPILSIWLILGMVCLAIYWVATTRYTVLNTERGSIYVILDKKHEEVLQELSSRRKAQLRNLYGAINLQNDPAVEMNKFRWLLQEGAISDEEFRSTLKEIGVHHLAQEQPEESTELIH